MFVITEKINCLQNSMMNIEDHFNGYCNIPSNIPGSWHRPCQRFLLNTISCTKLTGISFTCIFNLLSFETHLSYWIVYKVHVMTNIVVLNWQICLSQNRWQLVILMIRLGLTPSNNFIGWFYPTFLPTLNTYADYLVPEVVGFNPFPVHTSLVFGPADCGFGKHAGRI